MDSWASPNYLAQSFNSDLLSCSKTVMVSRQCSEGRALTGQYTGSEQRQRSTNAETHWATAIQMLGSNCLLQITIR